MLCDLLMLFVLFFLVYIVSSIVVSFAIVSWGKLTGKPAPKWMHGQMWRRS